MIPTNILDTIAAELEGSGLGAEVHVLIPRVPSAAADVVLAGKPSLWGKDANGSIAIESLASCSEVASVQLWGKRRRRKVNVRLQSRWLEALGASLECGQTDAVHVADLAVGRSVVVDFCDPNATKAFHVGHLRNLAVGNAIACLASAAGAEATTLCHVSDMGRAMGEALAGYMTHREGESPESAGVKSDHLVGDCYSRYSATVREKLGVADDPRASDPTLSEQALTGGDLAEEMLHRWAAGDAAIGDLWQRLRMWVADGQEKTLGHLGIRFDRLLFESEYTTSIDEFVVRALETGIAERGVDGSVGYTTGRKEYPYILLQHADGQWTQYLRCVAMWDATRQELGDAESIQVMGSEWLAFETFGPAILAAIDPDAIPHPTTFLVHGMVLADHEKVSSSSGSPWLVDDLLDDLSNDLRLKRLSRRNSEMSLSELATIVALTFFLAHPLTKSMTVSRERLLDAHANPGWKLVEGWDEAWDPRYDGQPDPDLDDADYRFLLLQAQLHRRFVANAFEELDIQPLLRFHAHLCGWFLSTPRTPRLARAMRTILREAFSALGLRLGTVLPGRLLPVVDQRPPPPYV